MRSNYLLVSFFCVVASFIFTEVRADGRLKACREDLKAHCKDVKKGGNRKIDCLKAVPDLKPDCKMALETLEKDKAEFKKDRKELAKETRDACKTDLESHCKDVKPGEGRIRQCLDEKKSVVSDGCKVKLDEKEKLKSDFKEKIRGKNTGTTDPVPTKVSD